MWRTRIYLRIKLSAEQTVKLQFLDRAAHLQGRNRVVLILTIIQWLKIKEVEDKIKDT